MNSEVDIGKKSFPGSPYLPGVKSPTNGAWLNFRKTLMPQYTVIWRDITVCYIMVIAGTTLHAVIANHYGPWFGLVTAPFAAIWLGYWLHALFLFGHEAAHANLAPTRALNDRLGDFFVWSFFGSTTRDYRKAHWQHHNHLGAHGDTEISYYDCLSPWVLLKAMTGVRVVEVMIRNARHRRSSNRARIGEQPSGRTSAALRTIVLHGVVLGSLVAYGHPTSALAWLGGVGAFFPLFATIRTIVEHRRMDATCEDDFSRIEHGPINRMFGRDMFSYFFGAAGFNRHLLHHWDPGISYTCFDQMEGFFLETTLGPRMKASSTSYWRTFRALMSEARRG